MDGISMIGKSSFGTVLVAGRNRVPKPATGMTAFLSFIGGRSALNDPSRFSFFKLLACLSFYAERGLGARFEAFDTDIFSALFANTIVAHVESSQRFLNLKDELTLTVANTQHRVAV